ncbi:MAG: DUF4160 domain-containing protein [Oligoflexia bacterium]|nr:DUF4160 domain-containing protein [Oligoflexia bacterium]
MAPTIITNGKITFSFYSNDHRPIHVHVKMAGKELKINIETLTIIDNHGFNSHDVRKILKMAKDRQQYIIDQWIAFFKDEII